MKDGDRNKKKIFMGISLIITAFVCVIGVIYLLLDEQQKMDAEIETLMEESTLMETEREVALRKAAELEEELGTSFHLEKLVKASKEVYNYDERTRTEGSLWVDREEGHFIITLGAVHGLLPGKQLSIYNEENEKIGFVTVETALDSVSYVQPLYKTFDDFEKEYYRVVIE